MVIALVVVLAVLLVVVTAYLVVLVRQIRAVSDQLGHRLVDERHGAVTLALVNRDLEQLVSRINDTVRRSEEASTRALREERRFRSFIADVSHDLRTPLTTVQGHLQLIARADLDPAQREQLERARRNAAELGALVERLYEYTYLLEDEAPVEPVELDVGVLVGECLLGMAAELEGAGLDVRFEPPSALLLRTDQALLTRIVQNLLRNAVQHGREVLEVRLVPVAEQGMGGAVALEVSNRVVPGTELDTQRLFERFYTADRSRSGRTSGLGLSIVKVLTSQLNGEVAAHQEGDRLTLTVTLPALPGPRD